MSSLTLIDGSGFIHRAFHALPPLRRPSDDMPVGAAIGFTSMLWRLLRSSTATHIAVAFDKSRSAHRMAIDPNYKGNRGGAPDDLKVQYPLAREAAQALNVAGVEEAGHEADDIIATYAEQARARGWRVTIVSSDKDLLQLTGLEVVQWCPQKREVLTASGKFDVGPGQVVDLQALVGDSTDNVPGCPGVGPKTAAALLNECGNLETILARARLPTSVSPLPCKPKQRAALVQFTDQILRARELVRLKRDVPVTLPLDALARRSTDMPTIDAFLARMESVTLRNEICPAVEEA